MLNRFEHEKDFNKLGRTFYGVVGAGTIGITKVPPPSVGRICTTTRSHSNKLVNAALQAVNPTEVLKVGGSGHKVLLLIEGKAHAYVFPSPGCKKWDTCAPEAILHALGGKVGIFKICKINGEIVTSYFGIPASIPSYNFSITYYHFDRFSLRTLEDKHTHMTKEQHGLMNMACWLQL